MPKANHAPLRIAWVYAPERRQKTVGALHWRRYHFPIAADAHRRRQSSESEVMQHKQSRPMQHLIMALFAIALVMIGWQSWVMASSGVGRAATFLGWFGVIACAVNLGWLVWFYGKRLLSIARPRDGAA
jgi:hypothetical protein